MDKNWFHIPIFVYGTLKRGEEREGMWPHAPSEVRFATTRAGLYDLGPYPALGDGDDLVAGELWFIAKQHMEHTLAVLDEIEGYHQRDDDLYLRRKVVCEEDAGDSHPAYTYFYAHDLSHATRISPNADGLCVWTANQF